MAKERDMTGIQKAALLFITLGPDASANIIKKLPERDIQRISYEIANTTSVKSEDRNSILEEFVQMNVARDYIVEGGLDYATNLLSKALGNQRAKEIMEQITEASNQNRPFTIARKADANQLLSIIANEHPQTIALIISNIHPDKAGQILSSLPDEIQEQVAYRIATMNTTSPTMIKEIEGVLNEKLSSVVRTETTTIGGIEAIVDILNQVDRATEKNIVEALEREDPELAEKIKDSMFVFEDITILDDVAIQRVLREIDSKDLALALKGSSEEVASAIFRNQSKRASAALKEDIEFLGPVRLVDVEKAQTKILTIIRKLDDAQQIVISRGGDDAIIV